MLNRLLLLCLLPWFATLVRAQGTQPTPLTSTYQFTQELIALTGSRYGREAI